MLLALAAVALPGALDSGAAAPPPLARLSASPLERVLGMSYSSERGAIRWLDPRTLAPLDSRSLDVGLYTGPSTFSPDGSTLVLGRWRDVAGLRFVDLVGMRRAGGLGLQRGSVEAVAWVGERRLLALAGEPTDSRQTLYVVDPVERRLLRKEPVPGTLEAVRRAGDRLVLLLSPSHAIGIGTLAVVDPEGEVRTTRLEQTSIGSIWPQDGTADPIGTVRNAALAVDGQGGRAYVVGADEPIAEIDLATLQVSYHSLDHPSLLTRFLRWLEPAAQAKGLNGPLRDAVWLGDGVLAVAGSQERTWIDAQKNWRHEHDPAGLQLVDTRTWTARTIDSGSTWCAPLQGLVETTTGSYDKGDLTIVAYDRTGAQRFRIAGPLGSGWLTAAGSYLYAQSGGTTTTILDAVTAATVGVANTGVSLIVGDSLDQS